MHVYFDDSTLKYCEKFTERCKTESREEAQEKHTTPLTPRQMEEEMGRRRGLSESRVLRGKRRDTPTQSFLHE